MAQHDYVISDASGSSVRSDLNNVLAAIASTNSGTARPVTPYAGQLWIDNNTPSSSVWTLYVYDGSDDISLGTIDTTNNVFLPSLNFDRLTAETAIATGDYLAIYDASATGSRKMVITDLLKIINSLTADSSPDAAADYVMTYDASAGAAKKVMLNLIGLAAATQSDQETATSTTTGVTPGRQHFHPSAAKAWVRFSASGAIAASYNVTSITDNEVGSWSVNIATDFSSANYCCIVSGGSTSAASGAGVSGSLIFNSYSASEAGVFYIKCGERSTGDLTDPASPNEIYVVFFGDQA